MREGGDKPQGTLLTPFPLSHGPGRRISPEAGAGRIAGLVFPSPGDSSEASDSLPALRSQQCVYKSLKEHWIPRHRLAGSQGWCSGSCSSQRGWQEGPVNPLGEGSLASREERLPVLSPTSGPRNTMPQIYQAGSVPWCSAHTPRGLGGDASWAYRGGKGDRVLPFQVMTLPQSIAYPCSSQKPGGIMKKEGRWHLVLSRLQSSLAPFSPWTFLIVFGEAVRTASLGATNSFSFSLCHCPTTHFCPQHTHVLTQSQPSAMEPACCDATWKHIKSWKNNPGPKRISVENTGERVKTDIEKAASWGSGVPPGRPPLYSWETGTRSRGPGPALVCLSFCSLS